MNTKNTSKRDTETTEFSSHGETGANSPDHREHFSSQFGWNCDHTAEQYYDHSHNDNDSDTRTNAHANANKRQRARKQE
jgi:hypothetical protein